MITPRRCPFTKKELEERLNHEDPARSKQLLSLDPKFRRGKLLEKGKFGTYLRKYEPEEFENWLREVCGSPYYISE